MGTLLYLKNLLTDPQIASITPTSSYGIKNLCSRMDFNRAKVIVEYGPATGVITSYMLKHLSPDGKLLALDTNSSFIETLRSNISDTRLHAFNDSAENVMTRLAEIGEQEADYVISGIPFSMLDPEVADRIVERTRAVLRPGGKFLVYQFLKPEFHWVKGIHQYLPAHFTQIVRGREFRNMPPLVIHECTKS